MGARALIVLAAGCGRLEFASHDAAVPDEAALADARPDAGPALALIEPESGAITANFSVVPDATASGGAYVVDGNGAGLTGPGDVTVSFATAAAATCYVWGRTRAPNNAEDSVIVAIDGGAAMPFYTVADFDTYGPNWQWVALRADYGRSAPQVPFALPAGVHALVITSREGQSQVDSLLITDDPTFVPAD